MTDITIIMVSYNSAHLIAESLDKAPEGCPIIVVDNASTDETCSIVKSHTRKSVKLIRNKENLGFGTANNIALRQCKTRYAFLLNPDSKISLEELCKLQAALEADNKAVMAGPRVLKNLKEANKKKKVRIRKYPMFHKNRPLLNYKLRFWVRRSFNTKDLNRSYECGMLSGSALLYDLHKMPEVIYFDEDIFMYKEESELQYRIIEAGYKLLLVLYARSFHEGTASTRWADEKTKIWKIFYYSGCTEGMLARKYPHKASKISINIHLWTLIILQAIRPFKALKYKAQYIGFKDGYRGKK